MTRETGALPPADMEWQIGKTAASISFVAGAEQYLAAGTNTADAEELEKAVLDIKSGTLVLTEWLSPGEFLERAGRLDKEDS